MFTVIFENAFVDLLKPDRVGVPHGPAAIGGKAVAGDVDRVDVCSALSESLGENARAFIDHDVETSFDDFFTADRPAGNAGLLRRRFNKRFDLRISYWRAAIFISIPTGSGFLTQSTHRIEPLQNERKPIARFCQTLRVL